MTERCVLSCEWNALGANDVGQWQAQEIFIELPGLLSIDAAPSHVVETLEGDRSRCTMNRGHCRTPDRWRAGEDISSHRIQRLAIAALQTAVAAEVSSGVSREHNGRRNKGSPQVSSYLETCRDRMYAVHRMAAKVAHADRVPRRRKRPGEQRGEGWS